MNPLEKELEYFEAHQKEWQHSQQNMPFAVICINHAVSSTPAPIRFFAARDAALQAGYKTFGDLPFLVKNVFDTDSHSIHPRIQL